MKRISLGLALIAFAFFAGAQKNVWFGLLGFLCFFTVGVTLIVEEYRARHK